MLRIVALLATSALAFAESGPLAANDPVPGSGSGTSLFNVLPMLVAMMAIFYFLLIRPQRKAEKKRRELIENTKPGDEVFTIGGALGKVETVEEAMIVVRLGSGAHSVLVPFRKDAIASNRSAEQVVSEAKQ